MSVPQIVCDVNKNFYSVGECLGSGATAKCYKFTDLSTNELYAGKTISKHTRNQRQKRITDLTEVSMLSNLKHENIVKLHNVFEDRNNIYIILEFCKEKTLKHILYKYVILEEYQAIWYMKQVLQGLSFLHQNKIIHRDLKLDNLFVNDQFQVKIGDFDLAVQLNCDSEKQTQYCGTHIAPEMYYKRGYSYKIDIWSIGCIMHFLLTGKSAFASLDKSDKRSQIMDVRYNISDRLKSHVKAMITNTLHPDPKNRPTAIRLLTNEWFNGHASPTLLVTENSNNTDNSDEF